MRILIIHCLLTCFALYELGCYETDSHENQTAETSMRGEVIDRDPTQIDLPPNLLSVLQQEMQKVESGMQLLLDYLARGEAQNAADIAMQIHDSFILKQSLSQEELQQLVTLLPKGFVQMDRAFHGYAKKLAEAAQQNDFAASIKIYGDMTQACVSCHGQYATEKFPGFSRGSQANE